MDPLEEEVSELYGIMLWAAESLVPLKESLLRDGREREAFAIDTVIVKLIERLPTGVPE
jgi:hypothetical protein